MQFKKGSIEIELLQNDLFDYSSIFVILLNNLAHLWGKSGQVVSG